MNEPETIHLDLRTILPVAALAAIVLTVIFLELCGREDVGPLVSNLTPVDTATPQTPVATDTPGPSPTGEPPTPTEAAQPGAPQRDATRQRDLATVAMVIAQYRENNGEIPSTDGNVQSLCVFEDSDEGCALREVLDPLLSDPLGDPGSNGYWYQSDGDTYTIWAQRETDQGEECENHPDHLERFDSLFCLTG